MKEGQKQKIKKVAKGLDKASKSHKKQSKVLKKLVKNGTKKYQNPKGGLNEAGRKHFERKDGGNLKAPVPKGKNPRRVSFAARFAGMKGPMKDAKGRPTRKALALKKWGFGSVAAARNFANRNKKK